jgi:hypothetical protein
MNIAEILDHLTLSNMQSVDLLFIRFIPDCCVSICGFWLPFGIFENEINFDETTIRFNSVVKQRICISKMKKKIVVLNWFAMKFNDWYRTGAML